VLPSTGLFVSRNYSRGVAVSEDLSHVFFTSFSQLVPGKGSAGVANLYVWHDGEIDYIAPAVNFNERQGSGMTPDGRVLIFVSNQPGVTTDATGGHTEIYRWAEADGSIECVTCPTDHAATSESIFDIGGEHALTKDGDSVVFETTEAIDPLDVNNGNDIYEWRNGRIKMVTDGVSLYPNGAGVLVLSGIDGAGQNILFTAGLGLTGYERDNSPQLYAAHIGGGFPRPATPPAPCVEDACQGPLAAPPELPAAGGDNFDGPRNPVARKHRHRKRRHQGSKRHTHKRHSKTRAANQNRKGAH
jgi:hypothetical protein